jgi:hypothetical protein
MSFERMGTGRRGGVEMRVEITDGQSLEGDCRGRLGRTPSS